MFFGKFFARRSTTCFFVMCVMFLICCLRLYTVATGPYLQIQQNQSSLRIEIARLRGTIYDCNLLPLNNQSKKIMAVISPTPRAIMAISSELIGDERLPQILERLRMGKPIVCEVSENIDCEGIVCATVAVPHSSSQLAEHTVGYLNASGHGVIGLEEAFDNLLYCEETLDAVFKTDGVGRIMEGEEIEITGNESAIGNGIVTTIDINIQHAAEEAALKIERGAVVVCDVKNGEIKALVSRPSFDCTRVYDFLSRSDSPLLNRTLLSYSVGSVFKPCVAAAGVELSQKNFSVQCKGGIEIADRTFKCHYWQGHGSMDVLGALAESCNVFFYKYALNIGPEKIYNMASALNFGSSITLTEGISTAAGSIGKLEDLYNDAALANLSIGQGALALSPVSMLTLYSAIANDGTYRLPSLVKSIIKGGKREQISASSPTKAMSEKTADFLREALIGVVTNGTGKNAAPKLCSAGGKTATAQTGTYDENGKEITNGWFCGFFPAEEPKYAVVVMAENAIGGDVAHVFADVVDNIIMLGETK